MARKPRIEISGGLYHLITRGNNRGRIFRSHEDNQKFLGLLARQKAKRPFYMYAYCLMPNHVHLLVEMVEDPISKIMQALLTAYSRYHNRKYKKVGHLFQARYKGTLCQTDSYLGELVRYIHLNPVRARIVDRPEDFAYSGHREYLGMDSSKLLDTEPLLRHFGGNKKLAVERYIQFVNAGLGERSRPELYEGRLLGTDEFLDKVTHRIGEAADRRVRVGKQGIETLLRAAEEASGLDRNRICSSSKMRQLVMVKEAIIVVGLESGIRAGELAKALGVAPSAVSKRRDAARTRAKVSGEMKWLLIRIRSCLD